jgi:hypothetical protein
MLEMKWLDSHLGSHLESGIGIERANRLYWNISIRKDSKAKMWGIYGGEALLMRTDSRQAVDAFLYGIGLAYAVLPGQVFEKLEEEVRKWVE